ncbi:uncharacterized protein si:dkey-250d21.1 isoform X1 [Astyanax mexicanus]|uniref:uncharacterized protein si:dkey-250d21.1 isoform X1 n=1 Tax=Astyanax mexicanus TaxID=7994 RepID=UPI0020CB2BB9|nr:uncharacterized protein si:dkey-250d21.1 isoform X1 [Astyanax mexicanus]
MPDCCAAAECKQSTTQPNVSFFRFPLDAERCKQWVGNCGRPDLQKKSPEYLHRHFKLCSKHFEASFINKESQLKCVLKDDAVPTIFQSKTNKDSIQTSGRKRTRQTAAEGPVKAKKTKDDPQPEVAEQSVKEESEDNSVAQNPVPVEPEEEDPATSKAKETLKVYFKETLALTGFSIVNNATLSATTSMGSGPVGQLNPICADKIESKEVLKLGEDVMREEIRNSLRLARFFSILLQDKTNIEGKDQIPVFIRTVTNDGFPQKHLMGFLPCDLDSDNLFLMLVSEIRNKWGLRMEHCRGFTYLTTGDLCQKLKELSCRMLRDFPQVVLAPSDPYAFNMWLIRSMPVLSIQEVVETLEEVAAVLRQSSTLMKKLHTKITATYGHIKGEVDRVKESCQNNWEYGTDAFQTMLDILEPLLSSIGEMCTSALSDVDTAIVEQLLKLKEKLKNFNFIISLVVLKNTLCCVSILNPSLRGIISISSTLQYTISNALKLLNKHLQEIPIFHRKWFSDAVGRAKKLGVMVPVPVDIATNGDADTKPHPSPEDYYRETLSKKILQYLIDEVKRVLGIEMVRILRWLSLVPSYMADHNFSIRKDKVADANLNNLARPDSFYDELGCWEVKWRHASKRRILPTSVFATLKIPDIGFYPNVQSLLRVLGSIPCINADADVYGQYDMVLERYHSYMKEVPAEQRLCNMAFVYINQDVHVNIEDMVQSYVENHPETLQLLCKDEMMEVQPSAPENNANDASKEEMEEPREMTLNMELERPKPADCTGTDKEALKSALQAAITAAFNSQSRQSQGGQEGEVEYVTKSEMNEVLKVCEEVVRERILSEIGNSFFSLFIDRAVRFGDAEFLPLFLRFVDSFDVMRLELMGFVDMNLDTESMCERLFDLVTKEWHLNLKYCRGQAYLGSGEVAYKLKAFACKVQETHPLAICTHCSCYSFNTWWSRSVPVASVSRAIDALEKLVLFFSSTPDLERELDQVLAVGLRESYEKVNELQGTFCSSWMEKHDSYDVFAQILEPLAQCLESLQSGSPQMWSLSVINQAKKLLQLIRDFDFIVAVVALKNVSSFTRELSMALQKDHFSSASQLCQIGGIVATLNRVKTNIKVFHQNWFDEACTFAQSLGVQVKVPDTLTVSRDGLLKPGGYYKDAVSLPLVDHLINSVKDHFSDDHKEALNFLSLVPCSVTMSYTFESLKSKHPLYVGDLPDPTNFFTELSCWKVKWKTKIVSPTVPDTIFQTLRLPLMQYFANINTLLKIMCVLPSTALEHCGEVNRHKMFQDYLKNTYAKDRSLCLAMLQLGVNFNRDLEKMVAQCLKVTPKTLEGICLDKESKTRVRNSDVNEDAENHKNIKEDMEILEVFSKEKALEIFPESKEVYAEVNNHKEAEAMDVQQQQLVSEAAVEDQQMKPLDENGHSADNLQSSERIFRLAAKIARRNCLISDLPKEEQDFILQELGTCHWDQGNIKFLSDGEILEYIVKSIRDTVLAEVQESPFFSIITDKLVSVDDKKYIPVFVRFVDDCTPKVELFGFLPFESSDADVQAKTLSDILTEEWGLQMAYCRGQSFMCMGASSQSLRKMSIDFLANYPLAVNTPSESCGLAYWLAGSLPNDPITKVLGVVEDLLLFFDQSPRLHIELAQTMEGLLNTPREALAEVPETCLSRWKKMEDFFDILVDMLEGVLSCLDSVSNNANGSWSNSMSIHALILSTAIRESDFVIPLVILKNVCAPLRNCSTVFRCGNPADIIFELEKIPQIVETLSKTLENISAVHTTWFEEAVQLAAKVSGGLSYPETVVGYDSPEVGYREVVSRPVLSGLIEEVKFNFDDCHLKALKVLSLLPTCNPLPILPEAPDKLYTIYQSDLPEPDMAEEDINTWATAWREKYQDTSPPASISETLHHPEAKSHPNVTALLKLVAVLPSISMECDLMKTTLNSMRTLLRNEIICRGSKTNTVLLLMHRQILQTLEEVIDMCMENDPESHGFLSQMKQNVGYMRMDGEMVEVHHEVMAIATNGSGGSQEETGAAPTIAGDQPEKAQYDGDTVHVQPTTAIPDGTESLTTASENQSADLSITTGSVTEENVITLSLTPLVQDVTTEVPPDAVAQSDGRDAPTVMAAQDLTTQSIESLTETVQNVTTGHVEAAEVFTLELMSEPQVNMEESVTEVSPHDSAPTTDSVTEAQVVTSDSVTAAAVVMLELSASQGITTEPEMESAVQDVAIEPDAAADDGTMEFTEEEHCIAIQHAVDTPPVAAELAAHTVPTDHETIAEDASLNPGEGQRLSLDAVPVTEAVAVEGVAIDSVQTEHGETTESVTAAQSVTLAEQEPAAQYVIPETDVEATVQRVTAEPDSAVQIIAPESVMEAVVEDISMDLPEVEAGAVPVTGQKYDEDVPMEFADEAEAPVTSETVSTENVVLDVSESICVNIEDPTSASNGTKELVETEQGDGTEPCPPVQRITTEPVMEAVGQHVTTEPNAAAEDVPMELPGVEACTTAVPVTEPPAQGDAPEPEIKAEDVPVRLPGEERSASPMPIPAAQDVPMELPAEMKVTVTELVTESFTQNVISESVASTENVVLNLSEHTKVLTSASNVTEEPVKTNPTTQRIATESVMEAAVQHVTTEPNAAAKDAPMKLADVEQCAFPEPVTTSQDVSMELIEVDQCTATVPVTEPLTLNVTLKPVASPEDVALDLSETTHDRTEANSATSNFIGEPVKTKQASVAASQEINLELAQAIIPNSAANTEMQEQVSLQDVSMEPEQAQSVPSECVESVPEVATELAEAQGEAVELVLLPHVACSMTTVVVQEGVSEETSALTRNTSENITTESQADVQSLATEPKVAVPEVSTKPVQVSQADVQKVTTEPIVAAVDIPTEPALATCKVPELMPAVPAIPTEPMKEPGTDVQYVTTEPLVPAMDRLTELALAACSVKEFASAVPDIPTQPGEDPGIDEPVPAQCPTVQPITPVPDISTDPATTVQSVTIESTVAVQDINMESVSSEQPNNMESVLEVATAVGVAIETAEVKNVSSEPMPSPKPILEAPDASMPHTAISPDVTMDTVVAVQDVVMESVIETQDVSKEPLAVVEDVIKEPGTDVQDVTMEAVAEEQDVSLQVTVDQCASVEHIAVAQDTKLNNESQDVSSQVSTAHQDNQRQQLIAVTQAGTTQASTSDHSAISPANSSSQCSLDNRKTVTVTDVADQTKSTVQESIDQSSAVSQDDTGHPKVVIQESDQDDLHQPMEITHDETVPHRVLFFFDGPVQETLVKEYATSKFFSILFEQQVEVEGHPYIPVGICYMDKETLCEDTLALVLLDKDVNVFADAMTTVLTEKFGLNFAFCRGQSILTVGVAGAQMKAVASLISQRYPQAVCTLNSSLSLNVWLARSSPVTEIADCSMWVEKLLHWLTEDAEKQAKLQSTVKSLFKQEVSKYTELSDKLTRSQWDRSHDVLDFAVEILEAIMLCLKEMKEDRGNQAVRAQAIHFLSIFQNFEFILTVVILKNILSLTKNISQSLQGGSLDLCQAGNSLPDLLSTLKDVTINIDSHLQTWLQETLVLASKLKISVHHSIQPVIMHYRDVVSKGAVTYCVNEITALFSSSVLSALRCMQVVPYVISKMEGGCIDVEPFKVYQEELPEWGSLQVELQKWREKWMASLAAQSPLPTCILDTLKATDTMSFPNIKTILQLLVVLPCCRGEWTTRQGKKSLIDFIQQRQTTLPVLYPS